MLEYRHLRPGQTPPADIERAPYRAVVIIEADVTDHWRAVVSEWLIRSGCLYMLAWGVDCSLWDDSVDEANLSVCGGSIPDEKFAYTTWHDSEPLEDVFWFAEHGAWHPDVDIQSTVLLHVAVEPRQRELMDAYAAAQDI